MSIASLKNSKIRTFFVDLPITYAHFCLSVIDHSIPIYPAKKCFQTVTNRIFLCINVNSPQCGLETLFCYFKCVHQRDRYLFQVHFRYWVALCALCFNFLQFSRKQSLARVQLQINTERRFIKKVVFYTRRKVFSGGFCLFFYG